MLGYKNMYAHALHTWPAYTANVRERERERERGRERIRSSGRNSVGGEWKKNVSFICTNDKEESKMQAIDRPRGRIVASHSQIRVFGLLRHTFQIAAFSIYIPSCAKDV
jgi:hypothetical protein